MKEYHSLRISLVNWWMAYGLELARALAREIHMSFKFTVNSEKKDKWNRTPTANNIEQASLPKVFQEELFQVNVALDS